MPTRKNKLTRRNHSTLLTVGAWNKFPHYAVIGDPCNFYLWMQETKEDRGCNGRWITGSAATTILNKLRELIVKDTAEFVVMFKRLHAEYLKGTQ